MAVCKAEASITVQRCHPPPDRAAKADDAPPGSQGSVESTSQALPLVKGVLFWKGDFMTASCPSNFMASLKRKEGYSEHQNAAPHSPHLHFPRHLWYTKCAKLQKTDVIL